MHYVSIVMDINRIKMAHPASFVSLPSPVGFVSSSCRAPFEVYTCGISAENKSFFVCQPSVEAYSGLPVFFLYLGGCFFPAPNEKLQYCPFCPAPNRAEMADDDKKRS